jgi:hypothetical protein
MPVVGLHEGPTTNYIKQFKEAFYATANNADS